MIGTFTFNQNTFFTEDVEEELSMEVITKAEKDFYESIKPALNALVKEPSNETISQIINFSRSI